MAIANDQAARARLAKHHRDLADAISKQLLSTIQMAWTDTHGTWQHSTTASATEQIIFQDFARWCVTTSNALYGIASAIETHGVDLEYIDQALSRALQQGATEITGTPPAQPPA